MQCNKEADKVSARITEILTEKTFNFTPDYLIQIHKRLFSGIFDLAGVIRPYNITKKEWVLDGDTVLCSSFEMIRQTLEYDFREEKNIDYSTLNVTQAVKQICKFISGIWQDRGYTFSELGRMPSVYCQDCILKHLFITCRTFGL